MAIQNNSAADVAVLWNNATKDVELKGTCFVYNNLSVLGATAVGNALTTSAASAIGGSIRVIASTSGNEASVGFYKCTDSRWAVASDMWVAGVKCWATTGYSIRKPILNNCFNINNDGNTAIPYGLKTPDIMVDTIKGSTLEYLTIDDNIIIIGITTVNGNTITRGFTYEFTPIAISLNSNTTLTYAHIRNGIITALHVANGLTYALLLGTSVGNMSWLGDGTRSQYGQSFQWSIVTMSSSAGYFTIAAPLGHSYIGNTTLTTNASYRVLTLYTALYTAITYRICNSYNILLTIMLV